MSVLFFNCVGYKLYIGWEEERNKKTCIIFTEVSVSLVWNNKNRMYSRNKYKNLSLLSCVKKK